MKSRRQFMKLAAIGALAAGASPAIASFQSKKQKPLPVRQKPVNTFGVGMAGYSFAQVPMEKAIEIMKKTGVTNLSLKDVYLPMNSTQEKISEVMGRFRSEGINVYTLGVIYMKSEQAVNQAFEYAKMAGVNMIVGAPNYDLLPLVDKKVKEYNIRIAIHNHGPDNPLFPNATDIWEHIKDLDPRIGICLDIGHTTRDGANPAVDAERYAKRLFDVHIKDVTSATKEGKTIEMGRGIIDIPQFVSVLRKIKFEGMCSLEFEKDMKDSLAGIAESIGYFRGVMAV